MFSCEWSFSTPTTKVFVLPYTVCARLPLDKIVPLPLPISKVFPYCLCVTGLLNACIYRRTFVFFMQEDKYTALHLAVEQEDLTSLHMVEFIATNR